MFGSICPCGVEGFAWLDKREIFVLSDSACVYERAGQRKCWRTDRSLFIYYAHYASYTTFPFSDVVRGNMHATRFLSLQSRTTSTGGEPLHSYFILVSILTCN